MNPIIICPKCNSSFREILDRLVRLTNEDIGKIDGMSVSNVKSISLSDLSDLVLAEKKEIFEGMDNQMKAKYWNFAIDRIAKLIKGGDMTYKELVPRKKFIDNSRKADERKYPLGYNTCISDHKPLYEYCEKLERERDGLEKLLASILPKDWDKKDVGDYVVKSEEYERIKKKVEKLELALDEIIQYTTIEGIKNRAAKILEIIDIAKKARTEKI